MEFDGGDDVMGKMQFHLNFKRLYKKLVEIVKRNSFATLHARIKHTFPQNLRRCQNFIFLDELTWRYPIGTRNVFKRNEVGELEKRDDMNSVKDTNKDSEIKHKSIPSMRRMKEKQLKKGEVFDKHSGPISVLKWSDKKIVSMISMYHRAEMKTEAKGQKIKTKPISVIDYNRCMGGVDLKDQLLQSYLIERKRNTKWYIKRPEDTTSPNECQRRNDNGKHIVIQAPTNGGSHYFNYKVTHSIILLGVANANYQFTYIDVGCNRKVSDGENCFTPRVADSEHPETHETMPGSWLEDSMLGNSISLIRMREELQLHNFTERSSIG
ncbi:hypothetical protein J437_LFUL017800 [Ladona fulva]|uniref:PiggyBac transposable element-derived protein domain-containing protein n=1 Tax=Ladona fulva TaxID=123851 RepID=A0A8K0KNT5_LADFU|nr:hypothetical protein J437_LFUL017800 [Ladona fulva]